MADKMPELMSHDGQEIRRCVHAVYILCESSILFRARMKIIINVERATMSNDTQSHIGSRNNIRFDLE